MRSDCLKDFLGIENMDLIEMMMGGNFDEDVLEIIWG